MRKPNGYGSIKRLSGNRRRPFVFVISMDGKQKPVEYFSTQVEAEIFQADYNKLHFHRSLPDHRVTLAELYYRWLPAHTANTAPSQSTLDSYANSFKHLAQLHYEPVQNLKYADYQKIIDFSDRMLYANVINVGQLSLTVDWQIWTRSTSSFMVYSSKTGSLGWLWMAIGK